MNNQPRKKTHKCEIKIKAKALNLQKKKFVCDQPDEVNLFILSLCC